VDLVAEKDMFLILVSPPVITVRVISEAVALPFIGASFLAEVVGISPQMSGSMAVSPPRITLSAMA